MNEMLEANLKNLSISGSFHDVAVEMVEAIANIAKKENSELNSRQALSDINAENINCMDEIVGIDSIATFVKKINLSTVRDLLNMQKRFVEECKYKLDMQRIRGNSLKITGYRMKVENQIEKRLKAASH